MGDQYFQINGDTALVTQMFGALFVHCYTEASF